jgi:hypothetical protein
LPRALGLRGGQMVPLICGSASGLGS